MKNFNLWLLIKKLIIFFLGVWIIQTGVAIFINTQIGSDPFTIFTQGISNICGVSVGTGNIIITGTFFVIILITSMKSINIGTVLALISAGPFIDLMNWILAPLHFNNLNIVLKIILLCVSCVIIAIGFSMLKATDLGVAPNDLIPLIIQDKTKWQYRYIRITMDITFVIIGCLLVDDLWKTFGIGTLISAFLQGPTIQYFMPILDKITKSILGISDKSQVSNN